MRILEAISWVAGFLFVSFKTTAIYEYAKLFPIFEKITHFKEYETEKQHQKDIEKLKATAIQKYGKNAWTEVEGVKARIKKERDEEMNYMNSDRNKMNNLFWWCVTAAALITYFLQLHKI